LTLRGITLDTRENILPYLFLLGRQVKREERGGEGRDLTSPERWGRIRREATMYKSLYPKDTFGKLLEPVPSDLVSEVRKTGGAGRKPAPSDLLE